MFASPPNEQFYSWIAVPVIDCYDAVSTYQVLLVYRLDLI